MVFSKIIFYLLQDGLNPFRAKYTLVTHSAAKWCPHGSAPELELAFVRF